MIAYAIASGEHVPGMAAIRAAEWGAAERWEQTIAAYLNGTHHPRHALPPRVCYVALRGATVAGFAAAHLTTRYGCHGEIQWVNVAPEFRRLGIASNLLRLLGQWLREHSAHRVCVDVDPDNAPARALYRGLGAVDLNPHWLVWEQGRGLINGFQKS